MPVRRQDDGLWLPMREVVPLLVRNLGETKEMIEHMLQNLLLSSGFREIRLGELICFTFVHDELRIATALSPDGEALACTHKLVLDGLRRRIEYKRTLDAIRHKRLNSKRRTLKDRRQLRRFRLLQRA